MATDGAQVSLPSVTSITTYTALRISGDGTSVALGALTLGLVLRTWRRSPALAVNSTGALDPEVADELHRFRQEFGR